MKNILVLTVANILLFWNISCTHAQDQEKQIVSMLKEFYIAYNTAWAKCGFDVLKTQLDSLHQKYCSQSYRKELKRQFDIHGLDHDILISDVYTEDVQSLKTISVIKDKNSKNTYYVSYIAVVTGMGNKKTNKKIQIHLTVVNEDGYFKINNILDK